MATNVPNPASFQSDIATMGGLTFLTTAYPDGLGMSAADASALIAVLDQHNNLSTSYTGGTPAPQLNYHDNASEFWGGR